MFIKHPNTAVTISGNVTLLTNVAIVKGLIGSSSSVTNSVNASCIPALYGSLIATVTEYIFLDSGFQKV